jgi:hypothetical protein
VILIESAHFGLSVARSGAGSVIGTSPHTWIAAVKEATMLDIHDSPASHDRLADEVKAAVLVAIFGLVAMGACEALVAPDDAPIAREAVARAASQAPALYDLPGAFNLETIEIEPQAPTF